MRYNVNAKGNRRLMVAYGIIAVLLIFTILPIGFYSGIRRSSGCNALCIPCLPDDTYAGAAFKKLYSDHDDGITLRFPTVR